MTTAYIPAPDSRRRAAFRPAAVALTCALGILLPVDLALAQGEVTLSGVALDIVDDNRFFTRVGGTVRDDVTYDGLVPGQPYTLAAQLFNMTTQEVSGDVGYMPFTPEAAAGTISVELPVPQNRTDFNIDYVVFLTLYEGEVDGSNVADATALTKLEDTANIDQTIQLHAIQGITVTAADAADGDQRLPPEGGVIEATVEHVNLVAGYRYTLWGQLVTPSGQSTGIYASVPEYVPEEMNGSLKMEFTVPEGFEGLRLVPSVGLYHQNRVEIREDGFLNQLPDMPNPVMIASDSTVDAPEQTVDIGTPFEELQTSSQ